MNTKNENNAFSELDIITAYAQLVTHTLKRSGTEINSKNIKQEVKMFYEKFGNNEVKRKDYRFFRKKETQKTF